MIEKDITIDSHGNSLSGTVCLPEKEGRFPFVLMIHGTGPLDRNENMQGQQLNVFNTIAHSLADYGVASLRYDKRGCGKSAGNYFAAGHSDLINDATSWFDTLSKHEFCDPDRIFILGHSEGCIITPQVSLQRSVAGLILLCPFVDNMESILIKQAMQVQKEFEGSGLIRRTLSKIMGMTVASQRKLIQKLKSSDEDTLRVGFQKVPARSFRELIHLDPPAVFSQVTCPMLLIGGEKDLQCEPADVDRISRLARGTVDAHVIQNLTHVLRFDEGKPSILGSGALINKPIEPIVSELIREWFNKQGIHQK